MRVFAPLAVLAALVSSLAGCGGRDAGAQVDAYFDSVAKATQPYTATVTSGNRTYSGFIANRVPAAVLEPVVANVQTALTDLRGTIAGLEPPAAAEPVHAELLNLYARNARIAGQL